MLAILATGAGSDGEKEEGGGGIKFFRAVLCRFFTQWFFIFWRIEARFCRAIFLSRLLVTSRRLFYHIDGDN